MDQIDEETGYHDVQMRSGDPKSLDPCGSSRSLTCLMIIISQYHDHLIARAFLLTQGAGRYNLKYRD